MHLNMHVICMICLVSGTNYTSRFISIGYRKGSSWWCMKRYWTVLISWTCIKVYSMLKSIPI